LTNRLDRPDTTHPAIEPAQRTAAKVIGFLYLFQMATAIFGESYVRGRLIVRGDNEVGLGLWLRVKGIQAQPAFAKAG
jgi:hypothetical protein